MFENMILRPFEKIKMIRTQYHMTQQDLAGTTISRQLIGYIEKGQNDLSKETAIKIENNLREYFKNKGIEDPGIKADLLIENEDKQVEKIADKYNEDLGYANSTNSNSSYVKIHDEVKLIYDKYINKVTSIEFLKVIKILCEVTLKLSLWEEAKIYILKGIEISNSCNMYDDLLVFYNWTTAVCIGLHEYKGVIPIYEYALDLYGKHNMQDRETFTKITINAALACRKNNKNIECIEYLSRVEYMTEDTKNLFKINNLMGKSLTVLKNYGDAEARLLKALEYAKSATNSNNVNDLSIVLENLCILYLETNRGYDAIKYVDRIEQMIDSIINDYQRARNMYYLTIIEIIRDSKGKVKSLFGKVSNLAAKLKDELLLYKVSYEVCKYLICINDLDGLEKLAEDIYNISIESSVIHQRIPNVIFTIAEHFDELDNDEENKNQIYSDIRKKVSNLGYKLERQICRQESFEI